MLTAGPFICVMAEATEVPEPTVRQFVRELREAGLFTTGARGVNAPAVTDKDVARLLIALMVTDRPARAVAAARDFGDLVLRNYGDFPEGSEPTLALGTSLTDAVARIFRKYVDANPPPHTEAEEALLQRLGIAADGLAPESQGLGFNLEVNVDMVAAVVWADGGAFVFQHGGDLLSHLTCQAAYARKIKTKRSLYPDVMEELALPFRRARDK